MFVSHTEASGRCFLKKKTKERNKRRQMKTAPSLDLGLVVIRWPANHLILLDRVFYVFVSDSAGEVKSDEASPSCFVHRLCCVSACVRVCFLFPL